MFLTIQTFSISKKKKYLNILCVLSYTLNTRSLFKSSIIPNYTYTLCDIVMKHGFSNKREARRNDDVWVQRDYLICYAEEEHFLLPRRYKAIVAA